MLELVREQRLPIISLNRDHLKFVLRLTFSNLVTKRAVAKHKVVEVSISLDRKYRNCHLPKNNNNPKYEHKDSYCVVALSVWFLSRAAQGAVGKNFEYNNGYICSQSKNNMWHLCVLDEINPNQKTNSEEQLPEICK